MNKADCESLALLHDARRPCQSNKMWPWFLNLAGFLSLALLVTHLWPTTSTVVTLDDLCPQIEALAAREHKALLARLDDEFGSDDFKLKAYESLGGAIRVPTECYDDLGLPLEDPRWEVMAKLHDYLESRFPMVHANLKRTKVNTFALVYEWEGIANVKPLMLAAHMDVVPVNLDTLDQWFHPPYSGYYDGEWIWGRGSSDDKSSMIASLIAIETLLERGFVPSRTVILAFGSDEECGGRRGARVINEYLLETYGLDSLSMIVDEGNSFSNVGGMVFASPGVTEKGTMSIRMDVLTPGGHSSTPPKHTGIGILANLITELEAHPDEPKLDRERVFYQDLECRAKYDTRFPLSLTRLLLESRTSDDKLRALGDRLSDLDPPYLTSSRTTQAIDLIRGGFKVNALPEISWAVANYRIADHSSPAELMHRFTDITHPVAVKHNMTLEAFGEIVGPQGPSSGTIRLYSFNNRSLAPAPVTPTRGSGPYELLSGTIRSTIQSHLRTDSLPTSAIVSPGILSANTDTRHYWNLTRHIFRYNHRDIRDRRGAHTVNEAMRAEAFLELIRFFTRLILNADQSDLLE